MNESYLVTTGRERGDIVGRQIFDAFLSDPESEYYRQLHSSFSRALESGETDDIAHILYDIEQADGTM